MLAVYVLNNLFQAVAGWMMAGISQRALQLLRRDLFDRLQILPLRFFDRNPAGELMSRLTNDIDAINQAVSQNVTALVASVLSMVGILIAMFLLNRWLALVAAAGGADHAVVYGFRGPLHPQGVPSSCRSSLGELNGVMEETDQRPEGGQGLPPQRAVVDAFRERNAGSLPGRGLRQHLRAAADAADQRAGQLLRDRARRLGRLAGAAGLVSVGIIATFINYGQNFVNPAAPAGQPVQLHPGGAGRRGARLRDHRHRARSRTTRPALPARRHPTATCASRMWISAICRVRPSSRT